MPLREGGEHAAGLDLGQLLRVADEHDLRTVHGCVAQQGCEGSGADHAGLVDHEHGSLVESLVAVLEVEVELGDRRRADARAGLQLVRRSGGERAADHPVAGVLPGVAGGVEAERLAGARCGDKHLDRSTRPAHLPNDGSLFVADRRSCLDRTLDRRAEGQPSVGVLSAVGEVDDRLLESDHLCGREHRPCPLLPPDPDHIGPTDVLPRKVFDHVHRHTWRQQIDQAAEDVTAVERRVRLGQPCRRRQPGEHPSCLVSVNDRHHVSAGRSREIGRADADGQTLCAPSGGVVRQTFRADHLRPAGLQRRHLRRLRRRESPLGHRAFDLLAPLREQPDHLDINALDVGQPVVHRGPRNAEAGGELVTQLRLVHVAASLRVLVERGGVDRAPPAICGAHRVRHQHMGVQQRVPVSRRAMPKARSDEPAGRRALHTNAARPRERRHLLHVPHRPSNRSLMRSHNLRRHCGLAETPQDRHRLRRPERQIPPRYLPILRPMQLLTRTRVKAGEHCSQLLRPDEPLEVELVRRGKPVARRLTLLGVVVLEARDDLVQVVRLGARREPVEVQHDTPPPPLVRVTASPMQVCDPR